MAYNYYKEVSKDVQDYIIEHQEQLSCYSREDLEEYLNEKLWNEDCVTGNASGSYTFCTQTAKEYVCDNMELLIDACRDFSETLDSVLSRGWEYCDVTLRCYVLIDNVIEDAINNVNFE